MDVASSSLESLASAAVHVANTTTAALTTAQSAPQAPRLPQLLPHRVPKNASKAQKALLAAPMLIANRFLGAFDVRLQGTALVLIKAPASAPRVVAEVLVYHGVCHVLKTGKVYIVQYVLGTP